MRIADAHHDSKALLAYETADLAAAGVTEGEIIDTAGFESAELMMSVKTWTAGDSITAAFWESDDSGMAGENVVVAAEQLGSLVLIDGTLIGRLGYIGKKRYIQVKATAVGATTTIVALSGMILLGHAMHQPTAD